MSSGVARINGRTRDVLPEGSCNRRIIAACCRFRRRRSSPGAAIFPQFHLSSCASRKPCSLHASGRPWGAADGRRRGDPKPLRRTPSCAEPGIDSLSLVVGLRVVPTIPRSAVLHEVPVARPEVEQNGDKFFPVKARVGIGWHEPPDSNACGTSKALSQRRQIEQGAPRHGFQEQRRGDDGPSGR